MTDRPLPPGFDEDDARALDALGVRGVGARGCPDPALVLALEAGVLDDDVAARVRTHATSCPACRSAAANLAAVFDEGVPAATKQRLDARVAAGRPRPRRRFALWLVPAGGLAAAALALFNFWPHQPPPAPPETANARATPPPVPSVFVLDRPAIPPGEIDLTLRGELTAAEVDNRAALALDQADTGDLEGALTALTALVRDHPPSRRTGLALGAAQLRAGRNAEAVATLDRARAIRTHPEFADEVDWFLSIALVRTGDRARARGLLEGVCQRAGARGARACAGVAEIDRR
jgi:hypothetical protein